MSSTQDWVVEFFSRKNDLSKDENTSEVNYFDEKFIDSFGVIELVGEVEEKHQITLPSDAFQDRRFFTIGGLAEIIDEQKS